VNRSRFSEPEDVLFSEDGRYNGLGVVQFQVSDVPARVDSGQGPIYIFFLRHVPIDEPPNINYAHSEISSAREIEPSELKDPSKTAKALFKAQLVKRIRSEQIKIEAAL
jgi:hypothetical protein